MRVVAAAALLAVVARAAAARGDDRAERFDPPAPPTLPSLAHPTLTDTFEITAASIDPGKGRRRAAAWFLHDELEHPLLSRVLYLGAAHDVVAGAVPGVGHDFFFGAPELWVRALWSSVAGFSSGGGLGVVLPAPHGLAAGSPAQQVFDVVRVVRPWDAAYFTDMTVTLRPWIDVRHVVWRFVFQLRQGLDVGIVARSLHSGERRADYAARTTVYAGFRVAKPLGIGLEVWEVYQITADIPDDKRAAFSISPSVRLSLGRIEPALSVLFPVATPLEGEAASYWAVRFNVGFAFEPEGAKLSSP